MRMLICAVALLFIMSGVVFAQDAAPAAKTPSGLEVMYELSYKLDSCGDADFGGYVRKAAMDALDYCQVRPDERAAFKKQAAVIDQGARQELAQYLHTNGSYPEKLDGDKLTCKEKMADTKYLANKDLFAQYARGQASLAKVLPDTCKLTEPFGGGQ